MMCLGTFGRGSRSDPGWWRKVPGARVDRRAVYADVLQPEQLTAGQGLT